MTLDLAAVAVRIAELRADDDVMSEAPWAVSDQPDFVVTSAGVLVCDTYAAANDVRNAAGIARTRNSLASTAEMLEAAVREVARLTADLDHAVSENFSFNVKVSLEINENRRDIARLTAENEQLRNLVSKDKK